MKKFILDKSYLASCSGEEIANDDSLVVCPTLIYEILKETKNSNNDPKKLHRNEQMLEKLYLKSHINILYEHLGTMLKYENKELKPYTKNIIGTIDRNQFKEACANVSLDNMNEERDFIKSFTALVIATASNEGLSSIFSKKSKENNITIADITPEVINKYFTATCKLKKIQPFTIDEKWVNYIQCRSNLSLAIKINNDYSQKEIEKIAPRIRKVITLPQNNDNFDEHVKENIERIKNVEFKNKEIYNKIIHDLLDYTYLMYASLTGGIKTNDKNMIMAANHWNIPVNQ